MIETRALEVSYDHTNLVVENVSVKIKGPTITGIIGPNGAGKSTFLKAILNVLDFSGEVLINGNEAKQELRNVAYVEQKSQIDYTFPIKVRECVSLGTYPQLGLFHKVGKKQWGQVDEALAKVNLSEYGNRQISELSGGQFQRVLMARCLVQAADYIFLDEPFVGIDSVSEKIIMETLTELKNAGKTILIVHHDLSKVHDYFDQLLILNKKLVAFGQTAEVFTQENLRQAYGENLVMGGV
ncbi:manganese ABC transporter ATP-binding protein [Ligilactobacillus pabuli]|uniref:Manganese ABC transporter ATP-binding protein n=1 Tax=Ligilactobacillus pabuli TaxID=2886039 RepID=A0ABQ5JLL9_9LACO|nr:metal ABC transporter ATP-binding protein [Ligilactobacillus pabuli]GKS82252.1 manganese ABC transporter ATP-binding protein [Ligilactobacillus pabuli]HIW89670.1 metal ABC transporter ATP-binding protein [Candidatus Ligilactobacillus excrementipullorum]